MGPSANSVHSQLSSPIIRKPCPVIIWVRLAVAHTIDGECLVVSVPSFMAVCGHLGSPYIPATLSSLPFKRSVVYNGFCLRFKLSCWLA